MSKRSLEKDTINASQGSGSYFLSLLLYLALENDSTAAAEPSPLACLYLHSKFIEFGNNTHARDSITYSPSFL